MRFWQAVVVAQMAAGSVHADQYANFWSHLSVEAGAILFGFLLWRFCSWVFPSTPPPCGLAPASSEGDRE